MAFIGTIHSIHIPFVQEKSPLMSTRCLPPSLLAQDRAKSHEFTTVFKEGCKMTRILKFPSHGPKIVIFFDKSTWIMKRNSVCIESHRKTLRL
jgi:hypothetical protein